MEAATNTYSKYDSEELLVVLSMKDDDPEEAKTAFFELVNRHKKELLRYCVTMCNSQSNPNKSQVIFNPEDAKDIVWNAFYRLKSNPSKFDLQKSNTDDVEKAVEAYLKGIVKTEFKKKYFGVEKVKTEYDYQIDTSKEGVLMPSRKVLKEMSNEIEQALLGLSMKEREVFLAYTEFCPNKEYLPREIGELLRDKLNLGESTLRVYRKRAQQKITDRLNKLNGQ